jgi:hypothetical protein
VRAADESMRDSCLLKDIGESLRGVYIHGVFCALALRPRAPFQSSAERPNTVGISPTNLDGAIFVTVCELQFIPLNSAHPSFRKKNHGATLPGFTV